MESNSSEFDVLVVGAGFSGLYALHLLRSRGLTVRVLDTAPEIGGTWFWNAYPGARCDVESADYSYSFSPELDQDWEWTERYAAQPEILRYLNHVADRFALRDHIHLNTTVHSATYDESIAEWALQTDTGTLRARYCVFATGGLSAPLAPPFDGADTFAGESYMTATWPQGGVDFRGKRVAVIGTGASGIQSIPEIATDAKHVTVLQRTPNFTVLGRNRNLGPEDIAEHKATYPERRKRQRASYGGTSAQPHLRRAAECTADEQLEELRRRSAEGGALTYVGAFRDVLTDLDANRVVADFVRSDIRSRITDPDLVDVVTPIDHPFAGKRPCVDHGYFEALCRDNVDVVSVRDNPITAIEPTGVRLTDGTLIEVDIIVYAIGYDAISGALMRIDIQGRNGIHLRDAWKNGPASYLGLAIAGFPNLFTVTGPGGPLGLTMMVALAEQNIEWIADCITDLDARGVRAIEATLEAQQQWTEEVEKRAERSIFAAAPNSYYTGANVPGKPQRFSIYLGGFARYQAICNAVATEGYDGFRELSVAKPR
ncbi:MAG: NAD(P)/FAD-dependent oxidoreductase [Mycobacterium sp.]